MIIDRTTFQAKPGLRHELIKWVKELIQWEGFATARVFTSEFGDYDRVTLWVEWDTMEDRQEWVDGQDPSRPGFLEFVGKLKDLREAGTNHELLREQ